MVKLCFKQFPYIITNRLHLRDITFSDEKAIFKLLSSKDVAESFQRPIAKSMDDAREYVKKVALGIRTGEWIIWGLSLRSNKKLIGIVSLWNISYEDEKAEISYELLPEYQRKGYMKEALTTLITYSFQKMCLKVIEARTYINNTRSIKLLEKCNFKEQQPVPKEIDPLEWDNPGSVIYRLYRSTQIKN